MSERLVAASLATQLTASLAAIETRLTGIEKSAGEHAENQKHLEEKLFLGNGSPGILPEMDKRIDRIEQAQSRRSTQMILLWTTILGILATVVGEKVVDHLASAKPPAVIQQDE